jgi:5-amino-6-(5-phosphoribosylamino)uracil reductase
VERTSRQAALVSSRRRTRPGLTGGVGQLPALVVAAGSGRLDHPGQAYRRYGSVVHDVSSREERTMTRPYVLLSVAVSVDGYIDDSTAQRLLLSNAADFDRVDEVRATSDALLIGATTIRKDNPRLLVNSPERRDRRVAEGRPPFPIKLTVTLTGDLDPDLRFWHHGGEKLVYCPDGAVAKVRERLGDLAEVIGVGAAVDLGVILDDLGGRGVRRLMVEGGETIHTQFLTAGLADEIHLAIAPILVGDPAGPRFVGAGNFPGGSAHRMNVAEVKQVGDVVLVRYLPKQASGDATS